METSNSSHRQTIMSELSVLEIPNTSDLLREVRLEPDRLSAVEVGQCGDYLIGDGRMRQPRRGCSVRFKPFVPSNIK